jgi:hypothetical protein
MTLRITGFLGVVHRLDFQIAEKARFRKVGLFPTSGERRETSVGFLRKNKSLSLDDDNFLPRLFK